MVSDLMEIELDWEEDQGVKLQLQPKCEYLKENVLEEWKLNIGNLPESHPSLVAVSPW